MRVGRRLPGSTIADTLLPLTVVPAGGWSGVSAPPLPFLITALLALLLVAWLAIQLRRARRLLRARDLGEAGRLRMLMANSPEGIWRVDPQGRTLEVNRSMAEMLGVPAQEIVGRPFRDFTPADSLAAAEAAFADGLQGKPVQFEVTVQRPDGTRLQVLVTTHPILDERGRFVEGFGIVRDITSRYRFETDRQHAVSLLEAALESTADGLLIVDREGRIVRFNERFARMWGIPDEILQSRDDDRALAFVLSQLEEPEQFLSKVRKLYAMPEAESFDTLRFRDGRVFERYSLPQRLDGEVVGRVWSFRDVTDRERAQQEQRLAMEREATIARNLDAALFTVALDPDGRLVRYDYVSRGAEALYGLPVREIEEDPNFWLKRVHPEDAVNTVRPAIRRLLKLQPATIEVRYESSRGIWRWHRSRLTPRLEGDERIFVDGIETDVTDRVALEEQFRHAQKMEAVGQLAGGVAHDFNNILTAVLGYADLLLARVTRSDPSRPALEEIKKGGERAAALTRQLLAFSRRATTQPRVVRLNEAIKNLEAMIRRLVGEDITFRLELSDAIGAVRVDPIQLEQVIVNLVVNARDAMPRGGTITIRTGRQAGGPPDVIGDQEVEGGPFVWLQVEDTGSGIPPAVLEHIFEPFFTTKEPGRGTGLGLAMVYGIVRQHGGHVQARSELQRGTMIEILLPELTASESPAEASPETERTGSSFPAGTETILLVEDDASLLTLARDSLAELGYRVLPAKDARDALAILSQQKDGVHILVTDVVMPGIGGRDLAERVRRLCPGLPVLYVSGYSGDPDLVRGRKEPGERYLEKPYAPVALARAVRDLLDAVRTRSAGGVGDTPR